MNALRHHLHQHPERSGQEYQTRAHIRRVLEQLGVRQFRELQQDTSLIAVIPGQQPDRGPTLLLRCELDALPVEEQSHLSYRSTVPGSAHLCGHDGHMAILTETARRAIASPARTGRLVLLYQSAEETGEGAAKFINDPLWQQIRPDYAFALHNMPGYPHGHVILRRDTFCCASRGVTIRLSGREAHAAQPETGRSPVSALTELTQFMKTLNNNHELAFATVVGIQCGGPYFGTAPGSGELMVTLRCERNETMQTFLNQTKDYLKALCSNYNLSSEIHYSDIFPATVNHDQAVDILTSEIPEENQIWPEEPIRWSEDFGHICAAAGVKGALFGLGAGESQPALHNPAYDFPDSLIASGADVFAALLRRICSDG